MDQLIDQAYQRALDLLKQSSTPFGFPAAPVNPTKPDYSFLFGRDTSICALAVLDGPDQDLVKTAIISLDTLRQARSPLGQVPFRVDPQTGYRDYWYPGNLDSTLWWALASLRLVELFPQLTQQWRPAIDTSLMWLRYQDVAETGLLLQGQRSDWADEMPSHGAVLYSNALWYQLLHQYNRLFNQAAPSTVSNWLNQAYIDQVRWHFNAAFWPYDDNNLLIDQITNRALKRSIGWVRNDLIQQPYFIQYLARRTYGWRCDLFANTLTLLTDLPTPQQRQATQQHLLSLQANDPWPGRTLSPVIYPGDHDWQEAAMVARNQNVPYQYHNGGIWPYIGGFWVAYMASVQAQPVDPSLLQLQLSKLAQAAAINDWQFNEYFHGQAFTPMGIARQNWNAAMYIAAHQAVIQQKPLFGWQTTSSASSTATTSANPLPTSI